MQRFEYKVLCSSQTACKEVMHAMKDELSFTNVKKTSPTAVSDHSASLEAKNEDEAYKKAKELMKKFKNQIYDVTVVPQ